MNLQGFFTNSSVQHMKKRPKVEIPGRARREPFQIEVGVSNRLRFRLFMFLKFGV